MTVVATRRNWLKLLPALPAGVATAVQAAAAKFPRFPVTTFRVEFEGGTPYLVQTTNYGIVVGQASRVIARAGEGWVGEVEILARRVPVFGRDLHELVRQAQQVVPS